MKLSTKTQHLLVIVLAIGSTLQQNQGLCYSKEEFEGQKCDTCYLSKPANLECGPVLPASDQCLFYELTTKGLIQCGQCKPGFELTLKLGKRTCQKPTKNIKNCIYQLSGKLSKNGRSTCVECKAGYPNRFFNKCLPAGKQKNLQNCYAGGLSGYGKNLPICVRCNTGYEFNDIVGGCEKIFDRSKGCLAFSPMNGCFTCDVYDGYTMTSLWTCKKVGGVSSTISRMLA